jgi:DNA-3-methyladenine glycosylase II
MQPPSRNGPGVLAFRPRPPLDARLTLARYRLWGVDPASLYRDGVLYRVARVNGRVIPFRVAVAGPRDRPRAAVRFRGPDTLAVRAALRQHVGMLLGETWDLPPFYARAAADPVLAALIRRDGGLFGLRPTLLPDPFEMLVGAISAQQINLAFALATRARLVRRFGEPVSFDGVTVYAFPVPEALAGARPGVLRQMQFSTRKAEYIIGLAREVAEGRLDLAALAALPDDAVVARLTAVRGLGRWSAAWFLARALGRPDVCLADDLGVRRAVGALYDEGRACDVGGVRRRAEGWRPHRSLAAHYLLAAQYGGRHGARDGCAAVGAWGAPMPGPRLPLVGALPSSPGEVAFVGRPGRGVTRADAAASSDPVPARRPLGARGAWRGDAAAWPAGQRGGAGAWLPRVDEPVTVAPGREARRRRGCVRRTRRRREGEA